MLSVLRLPPVRFAPFFAAGMLLCAEGGGKAFVMTVAAALLAAVVHRVFREGFISALGLLVGMVMMTGYIMCWVEPILAYADTTQQMVLRVSEKSEYSGYAGYTCTATVAGRPTSVTVFYDNSFDIGDIVTAEVRLSKAETNGRTTVRRVLLNAAIEQLVEVEKPAFSLLRSVSDFRRKLSEEIMLYTDEDGGALAQGLLFGDTSGLSLQLRQAAKISGVMHFTAVSGTHFIIIMTVLLEVFGERKKLRATVSAVCIPLAVLFFGAEPSVVRAGIMLFLCNCGPLFARESETLNSLCVSVVLMTAFTPYVLLDVGFQMSVLGVLGVAVIGTGCSRALRVVLHIPEWLRGIFNAVVVSACAVICISPISVAVFGGVSLVGVFATVVLTPLFTVALTLAVLFAVTGLTPLILPIAMLMKLSYYVILFFGSNSRLWLVMGYDGAELLALASVLAVTAAAMFPKKYAPHGFAVLGLTIAAAFTFSVVSENTRRKIDFVSDGTSGAAVVCIKDEAAIFLCGRGDGLDSRLADCLLENGIYHVRCVAVTDLNVSGAVSLGHLHELYPIECITADSAVDTLRRQCPDAEINVKSVESVIVDGITIACAKAGDTDRTADIVIYTGYKLSEPKHGARLFALYVSSRQNVLPDGAVNIYDTDFELILEN